jgi:hypothetical protein
MIEGSGQLSIVLPSGKAICSGLVYACALAIGPGEMGFTSGVGSEFGTADETNVD